MRTNFSYIITGDSPDHLKRFTPYCRKKINMLGWLILLPVTVWLFVGFTISSEMLGNSIGASILTAIVCSTVVFLIEFAILRADGGKVVFWFRFLLGFALAFVSGLAIDSLVFKSDVDWYMQQKYNQQAQEAYNTVMKNYATLIQQQEAKTNTAKVNWNNSINELNAEMNGTGGTHIPGYAIASNKKELLKSEAMNEYQSQLKIQTQLQQEQKAMADSARINAIRGTGINTFMHRVKNLHEMVFSSFDTGFFYVLFFFIAVCLELIIVGLKTYSRKSVYEKHLEMVDYIFESKNKQSLEELNYISELGYNGRRANQITRTKNNHSILN